jgi:hypothetical protein
MQGLPPFSEYDHECRGVLGTQAMMDILTFIYSGDCAEFSALFNESIREPFYLVTVLCALELECTANGISDAATMVKHIANKRGATGASLENFVARFSLFLSELNHDMDNDISQVLKKTNVANSVNHKVIPLSDEQLQQMLSNVKEPGEDSDGIIHIL